MNFLKKQLSSTGMGGKDKPSRLYSQAQLLHGHLIIKIMKARDLPDMESWLAKIVDNKDVSDPFVDVRLGKAKLAKTSIILNNLNPVWDEEYRIEVCHFADELVFEVRDKDHAYSEFIGSVVVPTSQLLSGEEIGGWHPIRSKGTSGKKHGELNFSLKYVSKINLTQSYEVDCYFPVHTHCGVTLYQDAHCLQTHDQFRTMPPQLNHYPRSCWRDLYDTLMGAEKLICITGWAVWHKLMLFRGPDRAISDKCLGDILIEKANSGVKVFVMVWSELTSGQLKQDGVMGTHDMETYNFFKRTKVNCALAPREMSMTELTDVVNNTFSSGAYTHHQKSVIADAPGAYGPQKRLVAFVGGLDLTGGRWDTPDHELFSTLLNEHDGDFRNSNAKSVPQHQGPREPWHDIHCKVEGPIAHDVLLNFAERWSKQGRDELAMGVMDFVNSVADPREISPEAAAPLADPARTWNCQLFRSITSDSADFHGDMMSHLNSKKGRMVDSSIAQAYIQLIRNAQNFIYIENQYFLGSAYSWLSNDDTNCNHTLPCEIAQKVVEKIRMNERFTAYIVIPMFPEGDPASAPIQEILYWQFKTMEMMYHQVGRALQEVNSPDHPTDWLLFLCPGKREAPGDHLEFLEPAVEPMARIFRESLRFPIYVHSKMMIVDDAYILVGSANINQRSMAGTRDTEMAIGSWQPSFPPRHPFGDVHAFRMSLFTEHFRHCEDAFIRPGTMECVRKVKQLAYINWQQYTGPQGSQTNGQMLPYPLNIMQDGSLEYLEGFKTFPDFKQGAKIKGTISTVIPQKVTT